MKGDVGALLFADDIQAFATNDEDLQIQARIVNIWARINGMTVNAKKSGLIGSNARVELGGDQVPSLQEYIYLGVPHRLCGINYEGMVSRYITKATKIMRAVTPYCNRWPEVIKLAIYKAFIRSRMEYCGPLLFAIPPSSRR